MERELPLNPATATLLEMESADGNPNVFGFSIAFPRDSLGDGPQLEVKFSVAPGKILDPSRHGVCKQIAKELSTELERRGRMELVVWTNWPSVAASIQKYIMDFNAKRGPAVETIQ